MNRQYFKANWPMVVGAVASFIYFGVGHFIEIPDFAEGFLLGISAAGYIVGAFVAKFGFDRISGWKKRLLHRGR
jgi:hypothetical protein